MSSILQSQMTQINKQRFLLVLTPILFFIAGFVVNLTSDTPLYNIDLNIVPSLQDNSSLGSSAFIIFMNIISNIFNPVICAGYVALFWIISSRKFQIMVFLVWFIFLSWILSILKELIHQPRPYWNPIAGVKMLEWTCYSEYGCPSGHSMLGLILMQFIVRFFSRGYAFIRRHIVWFYILVLILQLLVMFSRVILGMHTFNEVLMGAMIGLFGISVYYICMQNLLLKYMFNLIKSKSKGKNTFLLVIGMILVLAVQVIITYIPSYGHDQYWAVIKSIPDCSKVKLYKSFQYKCFQDSALIMAGFGLCMSLIYMQKSDNLCKPLAYSRFSLKYVAKLAIMIIMAVIPVAAFLNPGWQKIQVQNSDMAVIIWTCQNLGFFFAILMLLLAAPPLCAKAGVQLYGQCEYLPFKSQQKNGEVELSPSRANSCF